MAAHSYPDVVINQPNGAIQEDRSLRELLRVVLVESKDAAEKMAYLSTCIQTEPDMWLAYFLASDLLHREGAWQSSNQYLRRAVALLERTQVSGEISPGTPALVQLKPQQYQSLMLDARRTIGINAYHQKDYEAAQNAFRSIAEDTALPLGVILSAKDWIQRCQWAQRRTL